MFRNSLELNAIVDNWESVFTSWSIAWIIFALYVCIGFFLLTSIFPYVFAQFPFNKKRRVSTPLTFLYWQCYLLDYICRLCWLCLLFKKCYSWSASSKFASATFTASMTKAEKEQFLPVIACSTANMTSFGKRIVLFVVDGIIGISNFRFFIFNPRNP